MYEIVKEVIQSGGYELTDMLGKIDALWVESKLTDDQREELTDLAREHADPEKSNPELPVRMAALERSMRELAERVEALEAGGEPPAGDVGEYDPYTVYQSPMRCRFEGKVYEWVHPQPGNWSPKDYPAAWRVVEQGA